MRDTPLVGLVGKKRAGKDSFASTLCGERGYRRFAFADPLKRAAIAADPIVGDHGDRLSYLVDLVGWERAKEIPEVRRTLQAFGVSIREIDPDFWIRATLTHALDHPGPVVITDVRFTNEAEAIRAAGGMLVRIWRPGQDDTDSHVSETQLDTFETDLIVSNNGDLDGLAEIARQVAP